MKGAALHGRGDKDNLKQIPTTSIESRRFDETQQSPRQSQVPISQQRYIGQPRRRAAVQQPVSSSTMIDRDSIQPRRTYDPTISESNQTPANAASSSSASAATGVRRRSGNNPVPHLFGLTGARTSSGRTTPGSSSPSSSGDPQQPLPSLRVIGSELFVVFSLYFKHTIRSLRKPCRRLRRGLFYAFFTVFLLLSWLGLGFYRDASRVCTPPRTYDFEYNNNNRPLVEYYVHGHGNGHYVRSVAIIEELNKAGVDVRMFLSRSSVWKALHEDETKTIEEEKRIKRGITTAISVVSITPQHDFFAAVSHTLERIVGDCEVAAHSNRYPILVIADGDMPGMLRAKFGGIPSVGISHGQLFAIAQKPSWIANNGHLSRSWNRENRLNTFATLFSEWQIATHFCFLESKVASGVVARAPLRPEVLQMATFRKQAHQQDIGHLHHLPDSDILEETLLMKNKYQIQQLYGGEMNNKTIPITMSPPPTRRPLVICYFRDRNGDAVVKALLNSGIDVVIFEHGYDKSMVNDPKRFGVKWIVQDPETTREHISDETMSHRRLDDSQDHPRLIHVQDRSLFVPLMYAADGVASSAGSQLMSECIYSGMPLFALYKEKDDEQMLNVELSQNTVSCKTQVYGTSFESFSGATGTLRGSNNTTKHRHRHPEKIWDNVAWKEFEGFIDAVHSSEVSKSFYRRFDRNNDVTVSKSNITSDSMLNEKHQDHDKVIKMESNTTFDDPFHGLPDAAAIILEIIKQVQNQDA